MRTNKRKMISILTAFVMAFTVFGCTGMSFAEEGEPETVPEVSGEPADTAGSDAVVDTDNIDSSEGDDVTVMALNPDAKGGDKSVTISWTQVDPDTTLDPEKYVLDVGAVYYVVSTSGIEDVIVASSDYSMPADTTATVDNLKANTEYTFTITAYQKAIPESGELDYELEKATKTAKTDPAPINVPGSLKATGAYRAITLSWAAVAAQNNGTISYEIYDSNSETAKPIQTLTSLSWNKSGLSPRGKTYTYYIKAVEKDASGNVIVKSNFGTLSGKTVDFSTQKLTGLISDPGYKAVLLEWNRIDGATGYKVYWRVGGERGNIDNVGRDSDGHNMMTFRSKKTRKYEVVAKPGKYEYLTEVKNPASGDKVTFDKRGLKELNHTYVYFYQFMVIPYYDDNEGAPIYTSAVPGNKWKDSDVNSTANNVVGKSNLKYNIIRNNTVLPMYVYETAKVNKPIYKTCSMNDGRKRGRLAKGHKFICFDKANGRVKIYEKKNVSNPKATYWFAQKNAHTIQGYYMNNGNKNNLNRKDWKTGYSKKTVLDFVNKSGLTSKTKYLIWVSKYAQHAYVFTGSKGNWKLLNGGKTTGWKNKAIWSNLCTSGKVNIQSRNGNYIIFGKQHTAKRAKYTYYYLSKLHTTVRLHSLLHKKGQKFGGKLYNKALGNPVSKGCIRLRPKVSKWIYDKVPTKSRCKVW